mgnify:CR=1 FL=1
MLSVASMLIMAVATYAGNLFVYSVTGSVERKAGNAWQTLTKRAELQESDVVRVKDGASLSIIDKSAQKIYATGAVDGKSVGTIIKEQGSASSASTQFVAHAVKSLFNGNGTDNISHSAAGCTYRGDRAPRLNRHAESAKSILAKKNSEAQFNVSNEKSDFGVSFDLVDPKTGEIVVAAKAGREVYFRVKNNSSKILYVNVIDVASNGEMAECLPIDDAQTLSHLLIPANCVIDLEDYPIELTYPLGTDNLVLVASEVPYDLRQVNKFLKMPNIKADGKQQIGVYSRTIAIMQ